MLHPCLLIWPTHMRAIFLFSERLLSTKGKDRSQWDKAILAGKPKRGGKKKASVRKLVTFCSLQSKAALTPFFYYSAGNLLRAC